MQERLVSSGSALGCGTTKSKGPVTGLLLIAGSLLASPVLGQSVDVDFEGPFECGYTLEEGGEEIETGEESSDAGGELTITITADSCDGACPAADPVDDFKVNSVRVEDRLTGVVEEIASDIQMGNNSDYEFCNGPVTGEFEEYTITYNQEGNQGCPTADKVEATKNPVWYASGQMYTKPQLDFIVDDPFIPIRFEHSYASYNLVDDVLGRSWKHNYDIKLYDSNDPENRYFRLSNTGERFFAFPYTRVIDNSNPPPGEFAAFGGVSVETTGTQYLGTDYLSVVPQQQRSGATYSPYLPRAGRYEVFVRYPASASSPSSAAPVSVAHRDGLMTTTLDMTSGGGIWQSLGSFRFKQGNGGAVTLSQAVSGNTLADAVMFRSVQFRSSDGRAILEAIGGGYYDVIYADGMVYHFDDALPHKLLSIENQDGYTLELSYEIDGRLATITTPAGREVEFTYESHGGKQRISEISTASQALVQFDYSDPNDPNVPVAGRLLGVYYPEDASGLRYTYSSLEDSDSKLLEQIEDLDGRIVEHQTWAPHPQEHTQTFVVTSSQGGGEKVDLEYHPADRKTTVTRHIEDGQSEIHDVFYDKAGRVIRDEGTCASCGVSFEYDLPGNRTLVTDAVGRTFLSRYDALNNKLSEVQVEVDPNQAVEGTEDFDDVVLDPLRWKMLGASAKSATIAAQDGTLHLGLIEKGKPMHAGVVSKFKLTGNFDVSLDYKGVSAGTGTSFLFGVTANPNDPLDVMLGWIASEQSGTAGGWRWTYNAPGNANVGEKLKVGTHPEGPITADGTELRIVRSGNAFTLYHDGTDSLHNQDPNSAITISTFPSDVYLFAIVRSDPNEPTPPLDLDIDAITLNSGTAVGTVYEEDPNTLHRWEYANPLLPTAVTLHAEPSAFTGLEKTTVYDYDDPGDDADPNTPNSEPTVKLHRVIESGYTDEDFNTTPEPITRVTAYTYYGDSDEDGKLGQLHTIDGPIANDTVSFAYDAAGQLSTLTNALGQTVSFGVYDQYGRSTRTLNLNGAITEDTESRLGQILSRTFDTEGLNLTSTREYADDLLLRSTSPKGSVLANAYDEYRRLESMERRASAEGPSLEKATYEYNFRGQRTVKELRDAANSLRYSVTNGYGQSEDPNDSELREFVSVEAPSDSNDVTTTWLDDLGRPRTRKDPTGHATRYDYDARGRLESVTEKHVSDGQSGHVDHVTHYEYNNAGNLVLVTDPEGLVTTYVYDDFRRLLEVESPDSGTTHYEYDLAGRMTSKTQAFGTGDVKSTLYSYDDLGRLLRVTYETPGRDAEYFYDGLDPNEATSIECDGYSVPIPQGNAVGRLSAVAVVLDPNNAGKVVTTYEYDSRGLLLAERKYVGSSTAMETLYAYDEDGNVTDMTYPSGLEVEYDYDPNNPYRVRSITAGVVQVAADIAYEPFGGVKAMHLGNDVDLTTGYDEAYRLTEINASLSPWYLIRTYDRDSRGNVEQVNLFTNISYEVQKTFEYDEVSRLTSATGPWGSLSYRFDKSGNRLEAEGSEYSYDGSNQILTAGNFSMSYDGLGNLVQKDADYGFWQTYHAFSASPDDRLGQVTRTVVILQQEQLSVSTTFLHMPDGLRLQKNDEEGPPVVYHYDRAGNLLSETYVTDPSGDENPTLDYVYLGRQRVAVVVKQGESGEYLPQLIASIHVERSAWYAFDLPRDATRNVATMLLAAAGISSCILLARRRHKPVTVAAPLVVGLGVWGWMQSIPDAGADTIQTDYYFINGHLGEPLALLNDGGDMVWSTEYKPYGARVDEAGSIEIGDPNTTGIEYRPNLRFPGQYEDPETGMFYNHWRYYQPGFGSYNRPDPLGIAASGPSLYAYASENPVYTVDPFGLYVLINFPADREDEARELIDDAIDRAEDILTADPCCSEFADEVASRLHDIDAFVYAPDLWDPTHPTESGTSGFWVPVLPLYGIEVIGLSSKAFQTVPPYQPPGGLAGVIAHELLHIVQGGYFPNPSGHFYTNGMMKYCFGATPPPDEPCAGRKSNCK